MNKFFTANFIINLKIYLFQVNVALGKITVDNIAS